MSDAPSAATLTIYPGLGLAVAISGMHNGNGNENISNAPPTVDRSAMAHYI